MEPKLIVNLLTFLLPAASNLICCTIAGLDVLTTPVQRERRMKLWLMAFFFTDFFIWTNLFMESFFPDAFLYTEQLWYLAALLNPAILYIAVRMGTHNIKGRVSIRLHLTIPIVVVVTDTLWRVILNQHAPGSPFPGSANHSITQFNTQLIFELFFNIVYLTLCLSAIIKSYRKLNDTDDPRIKNMVSWMRIFFPFCVIILLLPSEIILIAQESMLRSLILLILVLLLFSIHVFSCINIMQRKYTIPEQVIKSAPIDLLPPGSESHTDPSQEKNTTPNPPTPALDEVHISDNDVTQNSSPKYSKLTHKLTKRSFDAWFARNKPYLDPELTIEDLLEPFGMNRAQLSAFVNRTYEMSFVNYVSSWRLKELEKLKILPRNKKATLLSLLPQAGFGSHKSYRRAQEFHANRKDK